MACVAFSSPATSMCWLAPRWGDIRKQWKRSEKGKETKVRPFSSYVPMTLSLYNLYSVFFLCMCLCFIISVFLVWIVRLEAALDFFRLTLSIGTVIERNYAVTMFDLCPSFIISILYLCIKKLRIRISDFDYGAVLPWDSFDIPTCKCWWFIKGQIMTFVTVVTCSWQEGKLELYNIQLGEPFGWSKSTGSLEVQPVSNQLGWVSQVPTSGTASSPGSLCDFNSKINGQVMPSDAPRICKSALWNVLIVPSCSIRMLEPGLINLIVEST